MAPRDAAPPATSGKRSRPDAGVGGDTIDAAGDDLGVTARQHDETARREGVTEASGPLADEFASAHVCAIPRASPNAA
jgi:hypothetical protein